MSSPSRERDARSGPSEAEDEAFLPRSPTMRASSPSAHPRASLDVREGDRLRPRDCLERGDEDRDDKSKPCEGVERDLTSGDAVSTGGRPPRAPRARDVASSGGHLTSDLVTSSELDPDATDVTEEVDALVSAACARGIGAAARTLREAMAMATVETRDAYAKCGPGACAARAMAEALAVSLAKRVAPGLAEAPRARSSDAETTRERYGTCDRDDTTSFTTSLARLDAEEDTLGDSSAPAAVADPRAVLLAAQLLEVMPRDDVLDRLGLRRDEDGVSAAALETRRPSRCGPRERVLRALRLALGARLGNCLKAARAGAFPPLARFLLSAARDAEAFPSPSAETVARLAKECVVHVAAETCEPVHVRSYLAMARAASGAARGALAEALAEALEHTKSLGPTATFELDGEGSGLLGATGGGEGGALGPAGTDAGVDVGVATVSGAGVLRRLVAAVTGATSESDANRRAASARAAFGTKPSLRKDAWPFRRGFAVVTWAYIESFRASRATEDAAAAAAAMASASARGGDAHRVSPAAAAAAAAAAAGGDAQEHMPRLFSFLSADPSDANGTAQGVEAYFHGPYLVVEATGADGRRAAVAFTTPFPTKTWRCVAVEHDPSADERERAPRQATAAPRGEARLYLDGALVESRRFRAPAVTGPLGFCCIGTNPPAAMAGMQRRRRQCALRASLGPVYVFREAVGARAAAELAARGGTYVPRYGARRSPLTADHVDAAHARLDSALAPTLLQVLHPATPPAENGDGGDAAARAARGGSATVPDLSPLGAGGTRSDRRGSLLGRAATTARTPIRDAIGRASPLGAAALLSLMCAEEEEDDAAVAAAFVPTLRAVSACLTGDSASARAAVAALEAAAFAPTLRSLLPRALRALRNVTEPREALDAAETKVVEALEVLVAERAPRGSALRASLCAAFFASLDAWTGGAPDEVRARQEPSPGVGVPTLLAVLRVTHAMAHVEDGAALRAAGGATRVLDAARTRARFPSCFSSETVGTDRGGPGGAPGGAPSGASPVPARATVPLSLRAGLAGAPPGPSRLEHAPFGARPPRVARLAGGGDDGRGERRRSEETPLGVSTTNATREALFAARGALLDALVAPVLALLRSDANAQEAMADVAAFAGDCEDPRLASRALLAALAAAESPGAAGPASRRAFVRAGGADACAGLLRALALRYEERHEDPRASGDRSEGDASRVSADDGDNDDDDDAETRLGAGELAASCARILSALARSGDLASPGAHTVGKDASFLDAALAERVTRHAYRLAPRALLTPEAWSSLVDDEITLGAVLESVPRASAPTRRRALTDARACSHSANAGESARGASPGEAARVASETARRVARLDATTPEWLVECVVREAADAADPRLDATSRGAARQSVRIGLDALGARWRRESARAEGWRAVETATRVFRESVVGSKTEPRAEAETSAGARATRDATEARARAARTCWALALDAHATYVAGALRRARDAEGEKGVREASRATLLAHARFLTCVVADALEEDARRDADADRSKTEPPEQSSPRHVSDAPACLAENDKEEAAARLGLLRSARALVDALYRVSAEGSATPPGRDVAAAALRVSLLSLRAAMEASSAGGGGDETADAASISPTTDETTTRSARSPSRLAAPLVSAACAEAAASADGVGAGGVSAADALGYEFLGFASSSSPSGDAANSCPSASTSAAERGRCLAATHRVLAPYLQAGRELRLATRTRAPHFALAALFSELKRNEATRRVSRREYPGAEATVSAFLCAHLLCLVGRWRSAVAEACADAEGAPNEPSRDAARAAASAASELLGTAEPTRAMLARPAAEAVVAALAPPWSDAIDATFAADARGRLGEAASARPDDDDVRVTEASRAARDDAERAAAEARDRAFAAFDARWRNLGAEPRRDEERRSESAGATDPADPISPFANLSAKTARVASRWRELLERASRERARARRAALHAARRRDEARRAFAERCVDAGFGAPKPERR